MSYFAPPRPSSSSLLLSSTKAGEVLGLTPSNWAMVPPKFHLRILLHARPSFRQLPCGSRSGVGTIVQRNEDFADYTAETSLSGRRLLQFSWPSLSLDWTSTRNEDSNDFDDLRLQKLARVSFVSLVGRRPALKQGSCLRTSQFRRYNPSWTVVLFIE